MFLSVSPTLDTSKYYSPNLLGGSVEYDVDLSDVSCGCVSQVAIIGMPAIDNWLDPFQYCDANKHGGPGGSHLCPEFDIMQANRHTFQSAAHPCTADSNGVYQNCNQGGLGGACQVNPFHVRPVGAFGNGDAYRINTELPFHVKMQFEEINNQYAGYTLSLSQGDESVELS